MSRLFTRMLEVSRSRPSLPAATGSGGQMERLEFSNAAIRVAGEQIAIGLWGEIFINQRPEALPPWSGHVEFQDDFSRSKASFSETAEIEIPQMLRGSIVFERASGRFKGLGTFERLSK
jgi:hypothetical protein